MTNRAAPRVEIGRHLSSMMDVLFALALFLVAASAMSQSERADLILPTASEIKEASATTVVNVCHRSESASFSCLTNREAGLCRDGAHWLILIRENEYTLGTLKPKLEAEAQASMEGALDLLAGVRLSARKAILRADKAAPYGHVQRIIECCAEVKIYKIELAARNNGLEGTFECWLPRSRRMEQAPESAVFEETRVAMFWDAARQKTVRQIRNHKIESDEELQLLIKAAHERSASMDRDETPVTIDAEAGVPWEDVINVINLAKKAQVDNIEFAFGAEPTRQSDRESDGRPENWPDLVLPQADRIKEDPKTKDATPTTTVNIHHRLEGRDFSCPLHFSGRVCRTDEHWLLTIRSQDYTWTTLEPQLKAEADESLEPAVDPMAQVQLSQRKIIIRADQLAPYGYIQRLIELCGRIKIYKIEVAAARPPGAPSQSEDPKIDSDDSPPKEKKVVELGVDWSDVRDVRVGLSWDESAQKTIRRMQGRKVESDEELQMLLQEAHDRARTGERDPSVTIDAQAHVSWREVVTVVNLAKRVQIERIEFTLATAPANR